MNPSAFFGEGGGESHQIRPAPPTTTGKSENKMANNKLQRKSEKEVAKKSHPHSLVETKKSFEETKKNASFWEMQLEKAALEMTVKVSQKQRVENYAPLAAMIEVEIF